MEWCYIIPNLLKVTLIHKIIQLFLRWIWDMILGHNSFSLHFLNGTKRKGTLIQGLWRMEGAGKRENGFLSTEKTMKIVWTSTILETVKRGICEEAFSWEPVPKEMQSQEKAFGMKQYVNLQLAVCEQVNIRLKSLKTFRCLQNILLGKTSPGFNINLTG